MAHLFATRCFGFSVMGPRTVWWGWCAWDAFAIPSLVPDAAEVPARDHVPGLRRPARVDGDEPGAASRRPGRALPHPGRPDLAGRGARLRNQRIYCSGQCVEHRLARTGNHRGYAMSLETLWRLSALWYDGRLDTPYTRRDPTAAAEYLRGVGLHGSFWGLPGA